MVPTAISLPCLFFSTIAGSIGVFLVVLPVDENLVRGTKDKSLKLRVPRGCRPRSSISPRGSGIFQSVSFALHCLCCVFWCKLFQTITFLISVDGEFSILPFNFSKIWYWVVQLFLVLFYPRNCCYLINFFKVFFFFFNIRSEGSWFFDSINVVLLGCTLA